MLGILLVLLLWQACHHHAGSLAPNRQADSPLGASLDLLVAQQAPPLHALLGEPAQDPHCVAAGPAVGTPNPGVVLDVLPCVLENVHGRCTVHASIASFRGCNAYIQRRQTIICHLIDIIASTSLQCS